jgi:hypothetical protein
MVIRAPLLAALVLVLGSACGPSATDPTSPDSDPGANQQPAATSSVAQPDSYLARTATGTALDELELLRESWSGDLDGMIERDVVRALVPMSKTFYFLDGGDQRGLAYDAAQLFEQRLNEQLERGHIKVHLLMIPVARDELIDGLLAGYCAGQHQHHAGARSPGGFLRSIHGRRQRTHRDRSLGTAADHTR